MADSVSRTGGGSGKLPARHMVAVVVGNALEFYDFVTYLFFALQIGRTFFPSQQPASSLLLSLATFGAGFLTRPVGGIVIGALADRAGRKPAMLLSLSLMGLATVGLALTPSYRAIGVAAPIMVVCWRLLQGFALGGEVGPATAFLVEAAPPLRRGLYTSLQFATQDFSTLAAGLVGFVLASLMDAQSLDSWGWRIALLIGAAVVPVGLVIRRSLPETLHAPQSLSPEDRSESERPFMGIAVLGLIILASGTVIGYVQSDLTTYAADTLRMSTRVAFITTMVSGLCGVCFDPVGGWLSDRFGRKPVMIIPTVLLVGCTAPAFLVVLHVHTPTALYLLTAVLGILSSLSQTPVLTAVSEGLPRRVRAGALGTVNALAVCLFGGSTPFVVTWLIAATGNPMAPGWYMTGAALICLGAMFMLRETAPIRSLKARAQLARA